VEAGKQGELSRIVAVRGCGHIAAFPNYEELVWGKDRCPICEAQAKAPAGVTGEAPSLGVCGVSEAEAGDGTGGRGVGRGTDRRAGGGDASGSRRGRTGVSGARRLRSA
jgi:hypothetical protein